MGDADFHPPQVDEMLAQDSQQAEKGSTEQEDIDVAQHLQDEAHIDEEVRLDKLEERVLIEAQQIADLSERINAGAAEVTRVLEELQNRKRIGEIGHVAVHTPQAIGVK